MTRVATLLAALSRLLLVGAAGLVLAMTGFVALSAIMRYFVGSPFGFTEELVALMFLAMVFFTIPISTVRREHIVVTVCVERVRPPLKRVLALVAALVMVAFSVWFVIESWSTMAFSAKIGARTDQVRLLLWPWMAIMPAIMALVAFVALLQLWQAIRSPLRATDAAPQRPTGDRL